MEQPQAATASEAGAGVDADADAYRIRPLELGDLSKGFCDLLAQLSPSAPLTEDTFRSRFAELAALGGDHLVLVAEDAGTGRGEASPAREWPDPGRSGRRIWRARRRAAGPVLAGAASAGRRRPRGSRRRRRILGAGRCGPR